MLVVGGEGATGAWLRAALEPARPATCTVVPTLVAALDHPGVEPDLCLLDAHAAHDVADATDALLVRWPSTRVVVISRDPDEEQFVRALRAGAAGYVSTEVGGERLVPALLDVLGGLPSVPRRFVSRLLSELGSGPAGD